MTKQYVTDTSHSLHGPAVMQSSSSAIYDKHMLVVQWPMTLILITIITVTHACIIKEHCVIGRFCVSLEVLWNNSHTLSWHSLQSHILTPIDRSLNLVMCISTLIYSHKFSIKNVCMGHHALSAIWVTSAGVKGVLAVLWQVFVFQKFRWNHRARGAPAKSRYSGHVNSRLMRDRSK